MQFSTRHIFSDLYASDLVKARHQKKEKKGKFEEVHLSISGSPLSVC